MTRRKDNAVFSIYTLILVVAEIAWLALIGYLVIRLLRGMFPEIPR